MTPDDWLYASLLLFSIIVGYFTRKIKDPRTKQWALSIAGFALITSQIGRHICHSLCTIIITCMIIKLIRRHCHILSFMWCFGYLVFFRSTQYWGFSKVPPVANAVQLVLTLKLISVAFEIVDSDRAEKAEIEETNREKYLQVKYTFINPNVLDIVLYGYCILGVFTGPYYKYRTYHDMLYSSYAHSAKLLDNMKKRALWLPLYCILYLLLTQYYTIEYATTDEFYARGFLYCLFYMVPMFTVFRVRMYIAWIIAEMSCICAGLGGYPKSCKPRTGQGPTIYANLEAEMQKNSREVEINFDTVYNIDAYGCEMVSTVREGMKCWNMSVQYWLAFYVYRRIPFRPIRTTVTMFVSAFWHGIHGGYYLSFLTIPICLMAEDKMASAIRRDLSPTGQYVYDWFGWFFRMRAFDYMSMGFLLLRFDATLRYWASIYFIIHLVTIFFIAFGHLFGSLNKRLQNSLK